jgi:hypothetical protein
MIRELVRDPHVHDACDIFVSQDRLRMKRRVFIERLARQPRVAPEDDVTHFTITLACPTKINLISRSVLSGLSAA